MLYGKYASLLLDFGVFTIGINILVGNKIGRVLIKSLLFVIAAVSLSVILSVVIKDATYLDGGVAGITLAKSLGEILHPYLIIALFGISLLLSLSTTMKLFQKIIYGIGRIFGALFLAPFELLGVVMRSGRDNDEPERNFTARNSDEFEQEMARTGAEEGKTYFQHEKIPDFLRNGDDGFSDSNDKTSEEFARHELSSAGRSEAPEWLSIERKKEEVLSDIKQIFDQELGYAPAVQPLTVDSEIEKANEKEKPELVESFEEDQEIEEIPARESGKEIVIDDQDADSIVEIVGEADYAEEARQRIRPDEEPPEVLFPEAEMERGDFIFPEVNSLEKSFDEFSRAEENQEVENVSRVIENTFTSFKIDIKVSGHSRGPAITRYEIEPPTGLKLKNIVNLTDDLALNLGTRNIRIVAPIGNRSIIGVEVPNKFRRNVVLRDIIESPEFKKSKAKLPLILGKDIAGNIVIEDLTEMPHLLIAGTTGSGKSVYVNSLIGGLIFTRSIDEVKFIFIDPKMVELELYNGIPHLLAPVITSPEQAIGALEWASAEMNRRYKILSDWGVRNIVDYNKEVKKARGSKKKGDDGLEKFPYIVIVIDEFANLMLRLPKETEKLISRIAAMARAVGIHLVVALSAPAWMSLRESSRRTSLRASHSG